MSHRNTHDRIDPEDHRQILEAIDVDAPAEDAYAQWTQFEEFPRFMENVEAVEQIGDRRLRWRATIFGNEQDWEAEITEQVPGKRIAWRSVKGAEHAGVVTFHRLSDLRSRVTIQVAYAPQTLLESVGDRLGAVARGVRRSLEGFKGFIEERGQPTGAWRGRVASPDEDPGRCAEDPRALHPSDR